jgi:hypothetical protein
MRLDGILAELMVKVAPNIYRKYITTNSKGKPVLYVQLEKAVYGMMKSALLSTANSLQTLYLLVLPSIPTTHASRTRSLMAINSPFVGMSTIF